jgi:hypothetical protein
MEGTPWREHHGGNIMEGTPWREHHGGIIMEGLDHHGGICPAGLCRFPGCTQQGILALSASLPPCGFGAAPSTIVVLDGETLEVRQASPEGQLRRVCLPWPSA